MSQENKSILKENWSMIIWLLAAVFTAGGIYAEFSSLKNELTTVHERLDKKIIMLDEIENRLYVLEKRMECETGS